MCYNIHVIVCIHQKGGYMKNLLAFTMAGDGQAAPIFGLIARRIAFTMAEILLSLTIIGVVAAITLPSLTGNINERTWNTQRKALFSRLSQAIALMPNVNGFGTSSNWENTAAETFLSGGLGKVFKLNNICAYDKLSDCGIPEKIITMGASTITPIPQDLHTFNNNFSTVEYGDTVLDIGVLNTKAAAFETANGESILLYYNPMCSADKTLVRVSQVQPKMCANFIYDLNGKKGPNTVGKDIGMMTVLYAIDSVVVAPMPINKGIHWNVKISPDDNSQGASAICTTKYEDARLPNIYELMAMFYNRSLFLTTEAQQNTQFWSSTRDINDASRTWNLASETGKIYNDPNTTGCSVRCIKR